MRQGYMVVQGRWHTVVGTNSKVLHKALQVPLIKEYAIGHIRGLGFRV